MMANVFETLVQQEINRPERDLKRLQLKTLMDEAQYKEQSRRELAALPQSTTSLQTLGSLAPEQTPFNPVAGPQMTSMDPSAQGSLSTLGVNPMQQQNTKPLSLLDGFQRQYNYHKSKGRDDYAQKVLQDQMEFTLKVADFADKIHKQQGAEGVTAWMKANPEISSVLGDPSTIKIRKEGVAYPVTKNESNEILPGKYWVYLDGKPQMLEDKPVEPHYIPEGAAIPDGKGGYTIPAPKPVKPEYKDRTRPDGTGTVFEESYDGGKTWKTVSRGVKGKDGGGVPKPGKALPAGTLTDLNEASQMIKTLKEAQGLAAGVNTGPVAGRWQTAMQWLGMAPGDFTQMKQKIATVNNAMLKLRSGAAVTESEYQRFLQEMPTANDTEAVRDAKFANATKYMEDLLEGKIATFAEGGYKVPTGVSGRSQPSGGKAPQPGKKGDTRPPLSAIFGTKR